MERYDFKTQRLYVDCALTQQTRVKADRAQANYLLNVLRMKPGDPILLFNGRDGEWLAHVTVEGKKNCTLACDRQVRVQPDAPTLHYLFAPLKQGRLDYLIQKAVEMGAGILQPVLTQYTQVTKLNERRIKANVIEAAEQCGILSLPGVQTPVKLPQLLADWDPDRTLIYCDEAASDANTLEILQGLRPRKLAVLIGPEGGFSHAERTLLRSHACVVPIPLGPRILRADTAGVAALALVQATIGDW